VFIELDVGMHNQWSINYDRKIPFNNRIGLNIGFGFSPKSINQDFYTPRFPIQIKMYYQFKKHNFNVGGTITPYFCPETESYPYASGVLIFGQIGYKYSIFKNLCYIGTSISPIYCNSYVGKILFFASQDLRFGFIF
jgi:hypothetical protein